MITLTLSEPQRQQLESTFKTTADRRLRERCQAILMANRQRRHCQIAQDVGVSSRTVQRWLNAYVHRGIEGLTMQWASGRPPHIPETFAPEILTWIKAGPAGCGLDRANWTYAELATYLYQTQGIAVSATTMRTFCAHHGVRPYRPTYRYRLWKVLRRRATHNRLFATMALLKQALRSSLSYYQTLKARVLTLIRSPRKRTKLPTA